MPPVNVLLRKELKAEKPIQAELLSKDQVPPRLPHVKSGTAQNSAASSPAQQLNGFNFQGRVPVIVGEVTYRGSVPVDGIISGELSANGGSLKVNLRPRRRAVNSTPELNGEISFKDMLRVNGHIAGKVRSQKGTLIIDTSARLDADIEVAVAMVGGVVNGDIIAYERVELGPSAIINGNISTRSLAIKPGAIFHGDCCMLKNESGESQH